MRNLAEVIEQLQTVIPGGESTDSLKAGLEDIRSSAAVASPEMMPFWWNEAADLLQHHIPMPKQNWEWAMVEIWLNNKPEGGD